MVRTPPDVINEPSALENAECFYSTGIMTDKCLARLVLEADAAGGRLRAKFKAPAPVTNARCGW